MAKTGPKGKPPALKVIAGTDQPCRRRDPVVEKIDGEPAKPGWLRGRAARLWAEKVAIYGARGQSIVGCESALAQYCALEAALVDQYRRKATPPVAQVNAFRILAAEFFDTPASQIGPAKASPKSRFAANAGKPPSAEGGSGA